MKRIIKLITPKTAKEIIEKRVPRGLFVTIEGNKFIALDNSDCNCWTEEFDTFKLCKKWLLATRLEVLTSPW